MRSDLIVDNDISLGEDLKVYGDVDFFNTLDVTGAVYL